MMDEANFDAYPHAKVEGKRYYGACPESLTTEERHLFERLNTQMLRLEQERVQYQVRP